MSLGKAINIVLFESLESQPSKAKCKPLTPAALVWCIVLLLWGYMSDDETKRDNFLAADMIGKRLLCQEEKLKFLSFRKEGEECLAGVSVQVQA